jgi:hypothetical protein
MTAIEAVGMANGQRCVLRRLQPLRLGLSVAAAKHPEKLTGGRGTGNNLRLRRQSPSRSRSSFYPLLQQKPRCLSVRSPVSSWGFWQLSEMISRHTQVPIPLPNNTVAARSLWRGVRARVVRRCDNLPDNGVSSSPHAKQGNSVGAESIQVHAIFC